MKNEQEHFINILHNKEEISSLDAQESLKLFPFRMQ